MSWSWNSGRNRNAIYKTMFDARRELRSVLAAGGYLAHDGQEPVPGDRGAPARLRPVR
jgi:hypothetical protein